jgi:hypothetical protein
MKIHLDKDTGIISISIVVALLLMFSVFQGHAQGQCCKNIQLYKKVQNCFERYTLSENYELLKKQNNVLPPTDTIKKKAETKEMNSMKQIKKAVPSMLISQHSFDNNMVREYCFLPGSLTSNYQRYEENK